LWTVPLSQLPFFSPSFFLSLDFHLNVYFPFEETQPPRLNCIITHLLALLFSKPCNYAAFIFY
jgi:hypothetical protein